MPDRIEGDHVTMILEFLAVRICQPCEPAHVHPEGKVAPLDVRGRNARWGRSTTDSLFVNASAGRGAVTGRFFGGSGPVVLHQDGVINLCAKRRVNGSKVRLVTVRCKLNTIGEPGFKVLHELQGVTGIAGADQVGHDQLAIPIQRRPGPHVSSTRGSRLGYRNVLRLGIAERPNLVALNMLRTDSANVLVMELGAGVARINKGLGDGIDRNINDPTDRSHRRTLAKHLKDLDPLFEGQLVHATRYLNFYA